MSKCIPIAELLASGKYVTKRNPWMKINPAKAKSECILAKTPYFAKAWGGAKPVQVEAMNELFKWLADQLEDVTVDARTDIIGFYMERITDKLAHEGVPETPEDMALIMKECAREAIIDTLKKHGIAVPHEKVSTFENALATAKEVFARKRIKVRKLKPEQLRKIVEKKLVRVPT